MDSFAIEALVQKALETNSSIIIAQSKELKNGVTSPLGYALRLDLLPKKQRFNYKDLGDYAFLFCNGWAWDKLYSRQFLESASLRFRNIAQSEDLYFVFMSLVKADSISVLEKVLFTHRKHKDSIESNRDKHPLVFLEALFYWQKSLKDMGIFAELEKSFANWSLEFCLWHLQTLGKEAHFRLFSALKKAFYDLGLATYPKAKFFNKNHYSQMQYILKIPLWLHKFNASRECDIKMLFQVRLRRDKSIIRLFGKVLYAKNYNED